MSETKSKPTKNLMASTWTKASKVARRLAAGRPRALSNEKTTPLQAVCSLFGEIKKAHGVMSEEGLRDDLSALTWELQYYVPSKDSQPARVETRSMVASRGEKYATLPGTSTEDAVQLLKEFEGQPPPLFLGIIWTLVDREDKTPHGFEEQDTSGVPNVWHTKFNSYPWNAEALTTLLEEERKQK